MISDKMAILTTRFMSAGLYVPYHTEFRAMDGLVGTVQIDAETVGDASGGTVTIAIAMTRDVFGFPTMVVPTQISASDILAAAEPVDITYRSQGNRRLSIAIGEVVVSLQGAIGNIAVANNVSIPIEGVDETERDILRAVWATNTNTFSYHLHVFAVVFDLQVVARGAGVHPLMAGIR